MTSPALSPRLPARNRLPLPNELILNIFHELLFETSSSASLVPCLFTCTGFYNILIGEPALWTQLRADMTTANLFVGLKPNVRSFWPGLQSALLLSQDRPISFILDLATGHPFQKMVTHDHLWALTFSVLWRAHDRCEEFIVRCSNWSNMYEFVEPLVYEIHTFPRLRRFELQYIPSPTIPDSHPVGDKSFVSPLDNPGLHIPDAGAAREYNDVVFPNLREVVLCNIPSNYELFSATQLTSLRLDNAFGPDWQLHFEELQHILMINSDTLTTLELGPWALGWVPEDQTTFEHYTLPVLVELKLTIDTYWDFFSFVQTVDLPSLKRLAITDNCHRSQFLDKTIEPVDHHECQIDCLNGYAAMMDSWPLGQVTHLTMTSVIFYETERNRVSLLQPSHEREEIWEGGLPLATQFFYKFSCLQQLEATDVDVTTKQAMNVPPRIFNPTIGTFCDVVPLFPSLRRSG